MNWHELYPKFRSFEKVLNLDVGCGYGGLLVSLASIFPDKLSLGLEIRLKVSNYVQSRISALRERSSGEIFKNIAVIRANAMRFLPNFISSGQLERMFFLFPDPHFKKKKHKARIISPSLLAQYAYLLSIGGLIYVATDVPDLFTWMTSCLDEHPLFQLVSDDRSSTSDPIVAAILFSTEEGHKVDREGGSKQYAVFERIASRICQ